MSIKNNQEYICCIIKATWKPKIIGTSNSFKECIDIIDKELSEYKKVANGVSGMIFYQEDKEIIEKTEIAKPEVEALFQHGSW